MTLLAPCLPAGRDYEMITRIPHVLKDKVGYKFVPSLIISRSGDMLFTKFSKLKIRVNG